MWSLYVCIIKINCELLEPVCRFSTLSLFLKFFWLYIWFLDITLSVRTCVCINTHSKPHTLTHTSISILTDVHSLQINNLRWLLTYLKWYLCKKFLPCIKVYRQHLHKTFEIHPNLNSKSQVYKFVNKLLAGECGNRKTKGREV